MVYYDYDALLKDLQWAIEHAYSDKKQKIYVEIIGFSELMRPILSFIRYASSDDSIISDRKKPLILIHGGIHAREHITSAAISLLIKEYMAPCPIAFIPIVNPDGVELSINGLSSVGATRNLADAYLLLHDKYNDRIVKNYNYYKFINFYNNYVRPTASQICEKKTVLADILHVDRAKNVIYPYMDKKDNKCNFLNNLDFSMWKANINGVDLNVNYDAHWGEGASNVTYPRSSDCIGKYPLSESENKALSSYTMENDFLITLSYHASGRVIYYGFMDKTPCCSLTEEISAILNYPLIKTFNSTGGYKDWFIEKYARLGLTIEIGKDIDSIKLRKLPRILKRINKAAHKPYTRYRKNHYKHIYSELSSIAEKNLKLINYLSSLDMSSLYN